MPDLDLLDALRRFKACCTSCVAPRSGSNFLPLLSLYSDDEAICVDGEEMEALFRAGMLITKPDNDGFVVEGSEEYGGIDADHVWSLSSAGRTALAREEADRG